MWALISECPNVNPTSLGNSATDIDAICPGKSKSTSHAPKEQKKKRKLEDLAEVAEAEEVTCQKELELAKATVDKDRAKLKVKAAETAYKMQKLQDKIAKRKERAKEKASKLCLLKYHQTQEFNA
jgi:hypothetical protein